MTDTPENASTTPSGQPKRCGRGGRGRTVLTFAAVALAAGIAGAAANKAVSHGFGHGHGFHRMGGPGGMDPSRAERMAKHLAVEIDATDAQRDKLAALAKSAATELQPLRDKMIDARTRGIKILSAPTVDRAALEALRAEQVAAGDAMSKRLSQLMADAAEVMTPEQRTKLAERVESRRQWFRAKYDGKKE